MIVYGFADRWTSVGISDPASRYLLRAGNFPRTEERTQPRLWGAIYGLINFLSVYMSAPACVYLFIFRSNL